MVDSSPIYHRVNAGEPKVPIRRGQKQLSLRVDLPRNELLSRLQEWVNPQAEETCSLYVQNFNNGEVPRQKPRTMMSLCQQRGKSTLSTSKLLTPRTFNTVTHS